MARLLKHFIERPRACSYLVGELAALEHQVMTDVSPPELESMLARGWRRFGPIYFRPACAVCEECVSLRIPAAAFAPSRSQRKALNRSRRFEERIGRPVVDEERLSLYRRWHQSREDERAWDPSPLSEEEYALQFAFPHPAAYEVALYDQGRLVSVSLVDCTPRALSAVYFFYDPAYAHLSLGVANVVRLVELAREWGAPHVYLGYRVEGCASLRYKNDFRPHEALEGRPAASEEPRWVTLDDPPRP